MRTRLGSLALAIAFLSVCVSAVPSDDNPSIPCLTAEEILAKYREAIGGERLDRITTIEKKSERETQRAKKRESFTLYLKAPDLFVSIDTSSGHAGLRAGFDGHTAWVIPPFPLKPGQKLMAAPGLGGFPLLHQFRIRAY